MSHNQFILTHVEVVFHVEYKYVKLFHVLSSRIYQLNHSHVSVDALRNKFVLHVLIHCRFIGDIIDGIVGGVESTAHMIVLVSVCHILFTLSVACALYWNDCQKSIHGCNTLNNQLFVSYFVRLRFDKLYTSLFDNTRLYIITSSINHLNEFHVVVLSHLQI